MAFLITHRCANYTKAVHLRGEHIRKGSFLCMQWLLFDTVCRNYAKNSWFKVIGRPNSTRLSVNELAGVYPLGPLERT